MELQSQEAIVHLKSPVFFFSQQKTEVFAFCFYHIHPHPINQRWGIGQGFLTHDSDQHFVGGEATTFSHKSDKVYQLFSHD